MVDLDEAAFAAFVADDCFFSDFSCGVGGVFNRRRKTSSHFSWSLSLGVSDMINPWDPFPFPLYGDQNEDEIYQWIGRSLDAWEHVEFELARMYSLLCGDPEWAKMQEYGGSGNIFRDRIGNLANVAVSYFRRDPHQDHEGALDGLITACKGFADRRNEVAHGMVMDVQTFLFWQDKMKAAAPNVPQLLVVPPYYHVRKHDSLGLPGFGYSSFELSTITNRLLDLSRAIDAFNLRVWPRESR
ncbi:hypothetical protein NKI63_18870 [Mesorhizobium sp. M0410]|uniref:hypothetical protein n=1 Tax=Mesorhizobium sp. M0410 TaxID=2956943 RepID=UPI0033353125